MKTSALFAIVAAAFVAAQDGPAAKYCKEDGTAYCLGGSIILRCSGAGKGQPGQCNANLSGYFPPGGLANCYEAEKGSGKAACEKNCIVHAEPSFTLPADKCTPSATETPAASPTDSPTSGEPTAMPTETPLPRNGTDPVVPPITAGASKYAVGGLAIAGIIAAYVL